jgi:hypothetical protein
MGSEKIAEKAWAYTLYKRENGEFVLSVVCGGAAMYQLHIPLDQETACKAIADNVFLEQYANEIRDDPAGYADRSIRM